MAPPPPEAHPQTIAALPPITVRQLGSSTVLLDPSSVVKELIDNALDARTSAIFVEIAANTLDCIQVKDTGHGISAGDRPLLCRRYCTSKIRDFRDVGEVGGTWLGFRGEALASVAEVSGGLEVVSRVEGEVVGARMRYGRDGELVSTEHASAPVGTCVKITNFFQTLPIRREMALKESAKILSKIKRLVQAYAFVRPTVRFSLRVLKAKSDKGDFTYAPKRNANVEDAAVKIVGKDCSLQCDWTAIESEGFEIHAFLPKPDAIRAKVANMGAFLSIDGRPISTSRGTPKKIDAAFKERFRKATPGSSIGKVPFFYMNINCPSGSYDPNIEPAKDDVLFEQEDVVIDTVTKLFVDYYPDAIVVSDDHDDSGSATLQAKVYCTSIGSAKPSDTAFSILEGTTKDDANYEDNTILIAAASDFTELVRPAANPPPRWRSTMYGIDEDDLQLLASDNQLPVIDEDDDERRAAHVSNPWTIARMNAPARTKRLARNHQLMTPAKGEGDFTMGSSSPASATNMRPRIPLQPLTPHTSSKQNITRDVRDVTIQRCIGSPTQILRDLPQTIEQENMDISRRPLSTSTRAVLQNGNSPSSPVAHHIGRHQQSLHAFEGRPDDDWFGKPMRGQAPPKPTRPRRTKRNQDVNVPTLDSDSVGLPPTSEDNTDIRAYLRPQRHQLQRSISSEPTPGPPSFTPINPLVKQTRARHVGRNVQHGKSLPSACESLPRGSSAEPPRRSMRSRQQLLDEPESSKSLNLFDQLRTYAGDEASLHSQATIGSLESNAVAAHIPSPAASSRPTTARPRTTDTDMAALFAAYSDLPPTPVNTNLPPHIHSAHNQSSTSLPNHRRITDRSKPSRRPSECLQRSHRIHAITLHLHLFIADITNTMLKFDMRSNTTEWGLAALATTYGHNPFSMAVTDGRLRTWVLRIDAMLEHYDTEKEGEAAIVALERGIKQALKDREDGNDEDIIVCDEQQLGQLSKAGALNRVPIMNQRDDVPPSSTPEQPQTIDPSLLVVHGDDEFSDGVFEDEELLMEF